MPVCVGVHEWKEGNVKNSKIKKRADIYITGNCCLSPNVHFPLKMYQTCIRKDRSSRLAQKLQGPSIGVLWP